MAGERRQTGEEIAAEIQAEIDAVRSFIQGSGIPLDKLDAAAALVYEWERDDEPDARVLVVKIARLLGGDRDQSSGLHGT